MSKSPESVANPLSMKLPVPPPSARRLPQPQLVPVARVHASLRYACPNSRWLALLAGMVFALFFHARDYIARGSYKDSEAYQLISSFKKHSKFRGTPAWRYKAQAIEQFARELAAAIGQKGSVAGVPPSKLPDHEEYDSRLGDCLARLGELRPDLVIETPFACRESTTASHLGGTRSIDEITANLIWQGIFSATTSRLNGHQNGHQTAAKSSSGVVAD